MKDYWIFRWETRFRVYPNIFSSSSRLRELLGGLRRHEKVTPSTNTRQNKKLQTDWLVGATEGAIERSRGSPRSPQFTRRQNHEFCRVGKEGKKEQGDGDITISGSSIPLKILYTTPTNRIPERKVNKKCFPNNKAMFRSVNGSIFLTLVLGGFSFDYIGKSKSTDSSSATGSGKKKRKNNSREWFFFLNDMALLYDMKVS